MPNVIALPGGVYNFGSETTRSMYDLTKDLSAALNLNLAIKYMNKCKK